MQQLLEIGFCFAHLLAIDSLVPQKLCALQLRFDDASLTALAETVMRERILHEWPQHTICVFEDGQRLLQIGKPQVEQLDLFSHIGSNNTNLSFRRVCLA